MATLQQIYTIVQPQNPIIGRVTSAMHKKCWAVLLEADTVDNHVNRLALAMQFMRNPDPLVPKLWRLFLSNSTVQNAFADLSALSDNDIEYIVVNDDTHVFDWLANMEAS